MQCDITWTHGPLHSNLEHGRFWVTRKQTPSQARQATMVALQDAARQGA